MYFIRYMNLAEAGLLIRTARRRAGMTQAELAARLHMSRATISQLENGIIGELGIRKIAQICDRLVVINDGRTVMSCTPHEVFARTHELRTLGLDVPSITDTVSRLQSEGVLPANGVALTVDEAVTMLAAQLTV